MVNSGQNNVALHDKSVEQLTKKTAKGGGILFIGGVIGKGINFLLQILLGRVLGTATYGLYALGHTIISIVQTISVLGLHEATVRFVALYKGEGNKARVKGTLILSLTISLISSIFISILLFILAKFISVHAFNKPNLAGVLRIFSISLPFYVLMIMTSSVARAFHLMQYNTGLRNIFFPIANILFVGLAFLLGYRLNGALIGFLISGILSTLLGLYFLWRIFPEIISPLKPLYRSRQLIRFSLPILFVSMAVSFLFGIDRLMLGWLGNSSDVGIYNAAVLTSMQIGIFIKAIGTSFSPIISDLYNKKKKKQLNQIFKATTRWGFILSLPLFLIILFFSTNIMELFGSDFSNGRLVLIVLATANLIISVRGPTAPMLTMSGKQDIELLNTIGLMGINIILNFLLIKRYGIIGAALASGVSLSVLSIVRLLEIRILLGIQPYDRRYFKSLLAGAIIILIYIFIPESSKSGFVWIAYASFLLLIYALLVYTLGLDKEDKLIIRYILNIAIRSQFNHEKDTDEQKNK
ncbi:MAG: flippase [Candidatus Krumholzibacteriota bacterium]|nr:flippase [Candidatus Krumholzibacteriota bacterium]